MSSNNLALYTNEVELTSYVYLGFDCLNTIQNIGINGIRPGVNIYSMNAAFVQCFEPYIINNGSLCFSSKCDFNSIFTNSTSFHNEVKCHSALTDAAFVYSFNKLTSGHLLEGSKLSNPLGNQCQFDHVYEIKNEIRKPIWFLFPEMEGNWTALSRALLPIRVFANKIKECYQILSKYEKDLKNLLPSEDRHTMTAKFCAITSIQIALFEVLKTLDIIPDGMIGHSLGEIACAYAYASLTTEEAMIVSYIRGKITESDKNIIKGSMILTKAEAIKIIPSQVMVCHTIDNILLLSGPKMRIKKLIEALKERNIFVHHLENNGIPYEMQDSITSVKHINKRIQKYSTNTKKCSKRHSLPTIMEAESNYFTIKYPSTKYLDDPLISRANLHANLNELESNGIVIEIGPNGVFKQLFETAC